MSYQLSKLNIKIKNLLKIIILLIKSPIINNQTKILFDKAFSESIKFPKFEKNDYFIQNFKNI